MTLKIAQNDDGTIVARKRFKPTDLLAHSFQFCEALTAETATYDELVEDFKADQYENKYAGKVAVVFTDTSAVVFTKGSLKIIAHDRGCLEDVFK